MKTSMKTMVLGAIAAVVACGSIGAAEAHGHHRHRHHHFAHYGHKHHGFSGYGYEYTCGYWRYGRFWACKSGY